MNQLVDRYLLFRIRRKHDADAFAELYDRYVKAIFRFARLKMPTEEDAKDITSETFTRAWRYLLTECEVQSIQALLYKIARNCIADYYRSRVIEQSLDVVTKGGESTTYLLQAETSEVDAELALVARRMESLKDDYRDVVTMRLFEGLSFREIGVVLEKTSGNVRVIYHRAIRSLRDLDSV
ncbi:MAG: sigma-70 family RNA polymerase sigma factor [bacterium]|nr:sigma-70 family RNA polymerase sigma factor [bacterium]